MQEEEKPKGPPGEREPAADAETMEAAGGGAEAAAELSLQLEDARAKVDEHWDALLRARAELENQRKRAAREVENAHKFGLERFALELLPVVDSLELGLSAAQEQNEEIAKLREGTELTLKMFLSALDKFGVTPIDPVGQRFDPEQHQAMSMQEASGAEPGSVISVIQKGYLLSGRLLRPALVIVAKETEARDDADA